MDDRTGTGEAADVKDAIDWDSVRARLARQSRETAEAAAPGGAWADALLRRRAEDLALVPSADEVDAAAGAEAPVALLVGRGADGSYGWTCATCPASFRCRGWPACPTRRPNCWG